MYGLPDPSTAGMRESDDGQRCTRNPKPKTRNPDPETRNPKPETRNPKPKTRNLARAEVGSGSSSGAEDPDASQDPNLRKRVSIYKLSGDELCYT